MNTTARKTTSLHSCACSTFEFGTFDPDTNEDTTFTTECSAQTKRVFAQGHDAKLVGYLVRAEIAGIEISTTEGGMRVGFAGAMDAAGRISDALAEKARVQLEATHRRETKKAAAASHRTERTASKAVRAEAKAATHRLANIKVGRWIYTAKIELATGEATFSNSQGTAKTVAQGKYTELA